MNTNLNKDIGRRAVVRLQLEHDELHFSVRRNGSAAQANRSWAVSTTPVRDILRHDPATIAELEAAIATVEDLIIPVIRTLPSGAALEISGSAMKEVVKAIRAFSDHQELSIEEVELLFSRLADVISGTPVAMSGIPVDASFSMSMVVLREVMHHGGYHTAAVLF
ncbi:MAG: hypothetical protein M0Z44_08345 [Gammaproteobacteria bacterium]|nr:hypothetical protein [Gammaproteobacteria bacterium]